MRSNFAVDYGRANGKLNIINVDNALISNAFSVKTYFVVYK